MTPVRTVHEVSVELTLPTDNAMAISTARRLAAEAGFGETDQSLYATAVSELATNALRYGGGGKVTLRIIEAEARTGVEVVAEDHGPGIRDVERAMQDHYTTGKSLGLGLPGVKRIMDELDIHSKPGVGTQCIARKWRR